jgi:hypothetical protein
VNSLYTLTRAKYLAANKRCARCHKQATDIHHTRGKLGKLLCDERYFKPMCRTCHRWVHDNIQAAMDAGLICEKGLWNSTR